MSMHEAEAPDLDWIVTRTAAALSGSQGITLTELGRKVGIAKATMSRRVNSGGWALSEVTRMAWALGYTANDLITGLGGSLRLDVPANDALVTGEHGPDGGGNQVTDE